MFNAQSLDSIAASRRDPHFAVPQYEGFAFAQLPSLVEAGLGVGETRMDPSVVESLAPSGPSELASSSGPVISLLLDGFGWSFFERFVDELPFLSRIVRDGYASKVTAQFPSTTAADITTFHTGQPVGETGIFEWQYFEPLLGEVFMPLPSIVLSSPPVAAPEHLHSGLYPQRNLYRRLAEVGVPSFCYQSRTYARSAYSRAVTTGAEVVAFGTLPEALVQLNERLEKISGPSYHAVYFDVIDTISHRYGPDSQHLSAEVRALFQLLESQLSASLRARKARLLVSADHGHISVDSSRTIYLDAVCPDLHKWLVASGDGRPLPLGGSPRDVFVYVQPHFVAEAEAALSRELDGVATVHRSSALLDEGIFGAATSRLRERLAPLVVLPLPHWMTWWSRDDGEALKFRGHHGGLSADELEVPLLTWCP